MATCEVLLRGHYHVKPFYIRRNNTRIRCHERTTWLLRINCSSFKKHPATKCTFLKFLPFDRRKPVPLRFGRNREAEGNKLSFGNMVSWALVLIKLTVCEKKSLPCEKSMREKRAVMQCRGAIFFREKRTKSVTKSRWDLKRLEKRVSHCGVG